MRTTILLLGFLIAGGLATAGALGACSSDTGGDCETDTDAGTGGACVISPSPNPTSGGGW